MLNRTNMSLITLTAMVAGYCLQTIAAPCPVVEIRRQYIGKAPGGIYLVQDFYKKSGKKRTNTFFVKEQYQAIAPNVLISLCDLPEPHTISGKYEIYYETGLRGLEAEYEDGYREGKWTSWYPAGEKMAEEHYQVKNLQGSAVNFARDGSKLAEGPISYHYQQDWDGGSFRVGTWKIYGKNGQLVATGDYDKGKKNNWWQGYCDDELSLKEHYKNDQLLETVFVMSKQQIQNKGCSLSIAK